ncbi:MAG: FAD-dependent oxidoreductase [Thermoleophilaceae bacterium]
MREVDLPFPVQTAVRLGDQAQFDPYRYLTALARGIPGEGSHLLERTRALDVDEGEPCRVRTAQGSIVAGDVIVATLIPFLDRGGYFARSRPERSYLIAYEADRPTALGGMYLSAEEPTRSLRTATRGGRRLTLVGGEGHTTGQEAHAAEHVLRLERFAQEHFGPGTVVNHWSSQDFTSKIGVPFVGRLTPLSSRVHVATAFGKWGMSAGTAAAVDPLRRHHAPTEPVGMAVRPQPAATGLRARLAPRSQPRRRPALRLRSPGPARRRARVRSRAGRGSGGSERDAARGRLARDPTGRCAGSRRYVRTSDAWWRGTTPRRAGTVPATDRGSMPPATSSRGPRSRAWLAIEG